jgi:hypothetical protein
MFLEDDVNLSLLGEDKCDLFSTFQLPVTLTGKEALAMGQV